MTEHIPNANTRSGHLPHRGVLQLDLYRLLTMFLSSKKLAEIRTDSLDDPIGRLQEYEEDEIQRILISTAIAGRIIYDDKETQFLQKDQTTCGELISDMSNPEKVDLLNLREACNKIIHTEKIHYDTDEVAFNYYSNPILYFYGCHNSKKWKTTLNVVDYVVKYIELLQRSR